MPDPDIPVTVFAGHRRLARGPLRAVVPALAAAARAEPAAPLLVFDDATGRVVDVDLRGGEADILARLPGQAKDEQPAPRGRGRPKLGVVAREVTLLPRHWDWLAAQPGGASVALRRLVDAARRSGGEEERRRAARDAAYRFMSAMAGDLPLFEEAARALFAGDTARFRETIAGWPADIGDHAASLALAQPPARSGG